MHQAKYGIITHDFCRQETPDYCFATFFYCYHHRSHTWHMCGLGIMPCCNETLGAHAWVMYSMTWVNPQFTELILEGEVRKKWEKGESEQE